MERAGVCGRIIQVDLLTVLCTRGGIEVADDAVQLLVAMDTRTTLSSLEVASESRGQFE